MKQNAFIANWQSLRENKGTINKCLVDFVNNVKLAHEQHPDNKFLSFVVSETEKYESNKALNNAYYAQIKEFGNIGGTREYTRNNVKVTCTIKCSEWTIYKFFWAKYTNK
jgi:hypothetical protein